MKNNKNAFRDLHICKHNICEEGKSVTKNMFDNLTGQELRELIYTQKYALEDLDDAALGKLFDYETELVVNGEGDSDLLRRCASLMQDETDSEQYDEKFKEMVKNAMGSTTTFKDSVAKKKEFQKRPKKVLLVAAIVVILIVSSSLIASAFGFNILDFLRDLVSKPVGTVVEKEGITYINGGHSKKYETIYELMESEEISIMFPTIFPGSTTISSVQVGEGFNSRLIVDFITSNPNICVTVYIDTKKQEADVNLETYVFRNQTYLIKHEDLYYAFTYIGNDYYSIQAETYEDLVLIIKNMNELRKDQ